MVGPSCWSAGRWEVNPGGRQYWAEPDRQPGDSAARQVAIDLAGDIALQDADDLVLGHSLLQPALEIDLGPRVVGDADNDDAPKRAVGLAIPTFVGPDLAALLA